MPGPGIHIAVADRVAAHLAGLKVWPYQSANPGPNAQLPPELAAIANRHRNYFALGAVGPDLFFFLPDFRNNLASPLIGVMHFLDQLYAALDSWILEDWDGLPRSELVVAPRTTGHSYSSKHLRWHMAETA